MIKENSNKVTIEVNGKVVTFRFYNYEKLTYTQQKLIYTLWNYAMARQYARKEECFLPSALLGDSDKVTITWENLVSEGVYQSKEEARAKSMMDFRAFEDIMRKVTFDEEDGPRETIEQRLFRGAWEKEDGVTVDVNVRFCELSIVEIQIFSIVEGLRLTPDETGKFFHERVVKSEHAPKKRVEKSQTENYRMT